MQISKISKYEGRRGWLSRILFPAALIQTFVFDRTSATHYSDSVNSFINEYLRPRTIWLLDNNLKCRLKYYLEQGDAKPSDDRFESVKLVIEFRNPKLISLYKLRWG